MNNTSEKTVGHFYNAERKNKRTLSNQNSKSRESPSRMKVKWTSLYNDNNKSEIMANRPIFVDLRKNDTRRKFRLLKREQREQEMVKM